MDLILLERLYIFLGQITLISILLTPRKTGGSGGNTPIENRPYVKIATTTVIEKQKCILSVTKSRFQNESVCVCIHRSEFEIKSRLFFFNF